MKELVKNQQLQENSFIFKKKNLQLANQESEETTHVAHLMCQY
jgi:hypothetical protein